MLRTSVTQIVAAACLCWVGAAQADTVTLTFEGLQNAEYIQGYYSGGAGSLGSAFTSNYGLQFAGDAQALIDQPVGTGNFENEPSPSTVMFFTTGRSILNVPLGFGQSFGFLYSMISNDPTAKVMLFDGLDGTGAQIGATIELSGLGSNCTTPITSGEFCNWEARGLNIDAGLVVRSIVFTGPANMVAFDNVEFGNLTLPGGGGGGGGGGGDAPEPGSLALATLALAGLASLRRRA